MPLQWRNQFWQLPESDARSVTLSIAVYSYMSPRRRPNGQLLPEFLRRRAAEAIPVLRHVCARTAPYNPWGHDHVGLWSDTWSWPWPHDYVR